MANGKRLIDANALLYEYCQANGCNEVIDEVCPNCFTAGLIADAPTVDAVEVVRCKDCKHWHEETGWCNHHSYFVEEDGEPCHPWESNNWKMLNEDDFCSYGERRTDE